MTTEMCISGTQEQRMRAAFEDNAQPLFRFLLKLTHGHHEQAEDLLQETMLRAWRKLSELPSDASVIRRWLFIVARRVAIDMVRARQVRPVEVSVDEHIAVRIVDGGFDGLLDAFTLQDALGKLSVEHRTVLTQLYYGDVSVAEAAARLGIPEGTVRSRSFYALRAMRGLLTSGAAA
jgi:RNA polymerase sigma-70 factor, ECF subfamily